MPRAYVLLSGGIDSTTCLFLARKQYKDVEAISIYYRQRHKKEIEYAKLSCNTLSVRHRVLDLSSIIPSTMLTDPDTEIPSISYNDIKGVSPTYVPFRNGLILSAAASTVVGELASLIKQGVSKDEEWYIYFGSHAEDAQNWAYPDCTFEFVGAM